MAGTILHLRSETKPFEHRSFLTPSKTRSLIEAGYIVNVERSPERCFDDREFEEAGATLVPEGSWPSIPLDHIVLGLKELLEDDFPLRHTHVLFAHIFKDQEGWTDVLDRYHRGHGTLLDIEFLQDPQGRLLAPSGYHAGFAGAALAVKAWGHQLALRHGPGLPAASPYPNETSLIVDIKAYLAMGTQIAGRMPRVAITGASGRCGRGAVELCMKAGIPESNILRMGRKETASGGPYHDMLECDILVNCIYLDKPIVPFVDEASLAYPSRQLSVIADVSCDNGDPKNPLPIYTTHTSFAHPMLQIKVPSGPPLSVISIDHLPSLLPCEASEQCCEDLFPALLELNKWKTSVAWKKTLDLFHEKMDLSCSMGRVDSATGSYKEVDEASRGVSEEPTMDMPEKDVRELLVTSDMGSVTTPAMRVGAVLA